MLAKVWGADLPGRRPFLHLPPEKPFTDPLLLSDFCGLHHSNLPQLKKAWTTGQTDDISLKMLLLLACGLGFGYGVLQKDIVIILANAISLCMKLLQTSS